ncbi:hypothetical protein [uncultured Friedmanniella sp.]|uniref:hypothetical protein n=1 Tax=uncultured Friedmanniella sp. TaxID=335381 RepID=UPI0035CB4E46
MPEWSYLLVVAIAASSATVSWLLMRKGLLRRYWWVTLPAGAAIIYLVGLMFYEYLSADLGQARPGSDAASTRPSEV